MSMDVAIQLVANEMGIILKNDTPPGWVKELAEQINNLLVNDFNRLISILYRMDVSENKIMQLLKDNPGSDAGQLIASLVIERQVQKIKSRQDFSKRDEEGGGEERW